jgi:hypothetical protein
MTKAEEKHQKPSYDDFVVKLDEAIMLSKKAEYTKTMFPNFTYEDGVLAALAWMDGNGLDPFEAQDSYEILVHEETGQSYRVYKE